MPERLVEHALAWWQEVLQALGLAFVGVIITLGQHLAGKQKVPTRVIVGRAIANGGLAMSAGLILVWVPEVPLIALIGGASALASLGVHFLERLVVRFLEGGKA